MRFLSAEDDFRARTLEKIDAGPLGRVCFLLGLCEGGVFRHWGLERSHGLDAAVKALEECFYLEMIQLTREDINDLFREAGTFDRKLFTQLLDDLSEALSKIPEKKRGTRAKHFNYVIDVVRAYLAGLPNAMPTS